MIVTVRDLLGGADISGSIERTGFEVQATFGARMDIFKGVIDDPDLALALPERREIIVYDAPAGSGVVDPPWATSAYNTYLHGAGHEVTSLTPSAWTPRIFAGYLATPVYTMTSSQRSIQISAQDYTYRLRSTITNRAFAAGYTDQYIIRALFAAFRPDFTTDNVQALVTAFPAISFPVHSLEQFMQRITKVSRGIYRVDYFKRLFYGAIGQVLAPFSLAENPDGITSFGYENSKYSPDAASMSDRVWVVGQTYQSATQVYTIPAVLVDGVQYQFALPGATTAGDIASIKVAGVSKTFGSAPIDGDIANQSTFRFQALIQSSPPEVAFATTPTAGQAIVVTGHFRYPLVQIVTDPALVANLGGVMFEAVVRDRRLTDLGLAQQIGKAYLANQGLSLKGFTATVYQRSLNNVLLAPGQTLTIDAPKLFAGLGSNPKTFILTQVRTILDESTDLDHPYRCEVEGVDHAMTGGQ
jgi:hypothetical protein